MKGDLLTSPAPSPEKNPPIVTIQLKQDQVQQIAGIEPGMQVKVQLSGKVVTASTREPFDPQTEGFVGDLTLEMDSVEISEDQSGTMQNLLD